MMDEQPQAQRTQAQLPGLSWTARTDTGRFRPHNEDAFLALRFNAHERQYLGKDGSAPMEGYDYLFAVSDGMGGANAGEFASRIAVDKIMELLPLSFGLAAAGWHDAAIAMLPELYERTHDAMQDMGRHYEECRGMGATLSLCWFGPRRMLFAHIGDSRIYYQPQVGPLQQISHDHSSVWRQYKAGKLSTYAYYNHPQRNILERALGGRSPFAQPQVGVVDYQRGDRFLICSDGVSDKVYDSRLETLLGDPPATFEGLTAAERLIREGIESGSRDNLTAVCIEVV
jgi:protein phosphatase